MSTTKQHAEIKQVGRARVCHHCKELYEIGVNGVVGGCDSCMGIVRNPLDGSIISFELTVEDFIRVDGQCKSQPETDL